MERLPLIFDHAVTPAAPTLSPYRLTCFVVSLGFLLSCSRYSAKVGICWPSMNADNMSMNFCTTTRYQDALTVNLRVDVSHLLQEFRITFRINPILPSPMSNLTPTAKTGSSCRRVTFAQKVGLAST